MSSGQEKVFAMEPPNGVLRNPDAPVHVTSIIVVVSVFLPLSAVAVGIRLYTRAKITGQVAVDDYIMLAAFCFGLFVNVDALDLIKHGLGKHLWNVQLEPELYPDFLIRNVVAAAVYCIATGCAKGSILLFYLRIFPTIGTQRTTWVVFIYTTSYCLAAALTTIFSCHPIRGSWSLSTGHEKPTHCINLPVFYFANAGMNILSDIMTLAIPIPKLVTLQMPWKQKLAATFALSVGGLVCIISLVRLRSLYVLLTDSDLTWNTVEALMWCCLEIDLSIVGGCMAALKPFIQRIFPRLIGAYNGAGSYPAQGAICLCDHLSHRDVRRGSVHVRQGSDAVFDGRSRDRHMLEALGIISEESTKGETAIVKTVDIEVPFQSCGSSVGLIPKSTRTGLWSARAAGPGKR